MLVVGIAGGTGSGKTTVVKKVMDGLPGNQVAIDILTTVILDRINSAK